MGFSLCIMFWSLKYTLSWYFHGNHWLQKFPNFWYIKCFVPNLIPISSSAGDYRYIITKLSKNAKFSLLTSSNFFCRRFFKNKKGPRTSSQAKFFEEFLYKNFPFVTLHKLGKFHHQNVFTSKVI